MREFLADSLTPLAVYRRLRAAREIRTASCSSRSPAASRCRASASSAPRRRWWRGCGPTGSRSRTPRGNARRRPGPPLAALRELLGSVRSAEAAVPFTGGWVGFFGYDTIRLVERLPNRPPDPYGLPYAAFARFDSLVAFDHARQRVVAIANEIEGEVDRAAAERRLDELEAVLTESVASGGIALPSERLAPAATLPPTLSADEYQAAVRKAKALHPRPATSSRWCWRAGGGCRASPGALEVYRALRMVNPSPYMVLLETPDVALVSARRRCWCASRATARDPPDRRHPPARRDAGRGPPAGRGAARRPQGARRARDAGRPRPQRPRPGGARRAACACPTS